MYGSSTNSAWCVLAALAVFVTAGGACAQAPAAQGGPTMLSTSLTPENLEKLRLHDFEKLVDEASHTEDFVGLAVAVWAIADQLGGNGFIAAFTAGLAAGRITPHTGEGIIDFTDDEGQLLNLIVFFTFGATAIGLLEPLTWQIAVYGLLSLTLIRMIPVAIATLGSGLRRSTVLLIGWFGPRGLASIILGLVVVSEEPELPALGTVVATMTFTVLVSVFAHGFSAAPLSRVYARSLERDDGKAEMEAAPEVRIRT